MAFNYSPKIVTDGLVLYLDAANTKSYVSGSTTWNDVSRNNSIGTLVNTPGYSSVNGGSLVFNGTNNSAFIPYNLPMDPTGGITIEAWINPSNITSKQNIEIYRKENGSARHLFAFQEYGTILSFGLHTVSGYGELDVTINYLNYINQWTHVVATYFPGVKYVYRNGVQIGTTTANTGNMIQGGASYYIGSNSGTGEFFTGNIAVTKIYNRALSAAEIQQNFNAHKTRFGL